MIRPAAGRVLLKPVETSETVPGGRIILVQQARESFAKWQYEIVAVGGPEFCDDEDCDRPHETEVRNGRTTLGWEHYIDPRLKPGAWCIIEPRSLSDACVDGEKLYYARQTSVVGVFIDGAAPPAAPPRQTE